MPSGGVHPITLLLPFGAEPNFALGKTEPPRVRLIGLWPCIEECTVSSKLVRIPLVREGQRGESQASAGDENVYENSDDAQIFVGSS